MRPLKNKGNIELRLLREGKKNGLKYQDYEVILKLEYPMRIGKLRVFKNKRIFVKKVIREKHRFRLFDAYAVEEEFFKNYLKGRKGKFLIYETDTNTLLKTDIKLWEEKGVVRNYNYTLQRFLSCKFMEKINYE